MNDDELAEWAVRWDATELEVSLDDLAELLGVDGKKKSFEVRYAVPSVPAPPDGYRWSVRERTEDDGDCKLTYKLRGAAPLDDWQPAHSDAQADNEWDATLLAGGEVRLVYSHAWNTTRGDPPEGWVLEAWSEPVTMRRRKRDEDDAAVEEWLIRGRRYIEVSRRGTVSDVAGFAAWVAPALAEAEPLAVGMATIVLEGHERDSR